MINAFSGKLYMAPKFRVADAPVVAAGFANATAYTGGLGWEYTDNAYVIADNSLGVSVYELPISSDLVIESKPVVSNVSGLMNKKDCLEEITGKFTITCTPAYWNNYKYQFNLIECEIRLIDNDTNQLIQVMDIVPYFARTTKISDIIKGEITFKYRQSSSCGTKKKRFRICSKGVV